MMRQVQTNFTAGAISEAMRSRSDNPAFKNAAKVIENCRQLPQGGLTRRPGWRVIAEEHFDEAQIEEFIFNSEQVYTFFLSAGELHIWNKVTRVKVQTIVGCPWTLEHVRDNALQCSQNLDTMFVAHHDFETRVIKRTSATTFTISSIVYTLDTNGVPQMPWHKFVAPATTMWFDGQTGTVNAYTSADVFKPEHVGTHFRYKNVGLYLSVYYSPTHAAVGVYNPGLPDTGPDPQWDEAAFSKVRGWAGCTAFHEQRLGIASGRECPNALWLSTTIGPFNFNLGTGLPADAIKAIIYADRVVEIKTMVSYSNLLIFCSHGEFIVPWGGQNALTPSNFSVKQQSGYGIKGVKACQFDQATIFITRTANAIREFLMTQGTFIESYAADSITYMAKDLIREPRSLDAQMEGTGSQEAIAYVTNGDGTLAVLSRVKKENIGGWGLWTTQGAWDRIGIVDREAWCLVERTVAGTLRHFIEIADTTAMLDFSVSITAATPVTRAGPFPFHKGQLVHAVSGDLYLGELLVDPEGYVTTPASVTQVEIGFNFVPKVIPLEQEVQLQDGLSFGLPKRIVRTVVQLDGTISIKVGKRNLNTSTVDTDPSAAPPRKTGQFHVYHLGWHYQPEVVITNPLPLPFTLRALSTEVEV